MKICTFNLRTETTYDGDNNFIYRKPRILETIEAEKPDIIGFQEAQEGARAFLKENLRGYTVLGLGRYEGYTDEGIAIAYKSEKFDLVSYDVEWLSPLVHTPSTTYGGDQSGCPRMVQIAKLVPAEGGEPFVFCNTHLDHIGVNARNLGAMQMLQRVLETGLHFIIVGDFNAEPNDLAIKTITECHVREIKDLTSGIETTFHDFGRRKEPFKIDYIFTDCPADDAVAYAVEDTHPGGLYISDHYPVIAEFTF